MLLLVACAFQTAKKPEKKTMEKTKIIYVYDALCGWCFGFSPVIARFANDYQDKVYVDVVSGGLRIGGDVGPIGVVAPYIKSAYKDVERACGVKFGDAFIKGPLEEGSMVMNSLQPAIALCIIREQHPEKALLFAGLLHQMIYVDGKGPEDLAAYEPYVAKVGYDIADFRKKMRDPAHTEKAQQDFARAQRLGATAFPTVLIEKNGKIERLFSGYVPYERMKQVVDSKLP